MRLLKGRGGGNWHPVFGRQIRLITICEEELGGRGQEGRRGGEVEGGENGERKGKIEKKKHEREGWGPFKSKSHFLEAILHHIATFLPVPKNTISATDTHLKKSRHDIPSSAQTANYLAEFSQLVTRSLISPSGRYCLNSYLALLLTRFFAFFKDNRDR